MSKRFALTRIHPDGREGAPVPDLTPARARGLAYLFITDNRYGTENEAHDLAVLATRKRGETVTLPSGAGVRAD